MIKNIFCILFVMNFVVSCLPSDYHVDNSISQVKCRREKTQVNNYGGKSGMARRQKESRNR